MKDDNNFINNEKIKEDIVLEFKKRLRNLETEKQLLDTERLRLEKNLNALQNEVDRLRQPPLVAAVIVSVNEEEGRATIISSTGPMLVVNISQKVRNQKLESGMFVGLDRRTFAIMEILSITEEEVRLAKSKIYKH